MTLGIAEFNNGGEPAKAPAKNKAPAKKPEAKKPAAKKNAKKK